MFYPTFFLSLHWLEGAKFELRSLRVPCCHVATRGNWPLAPGQGLQPAPFFAYPWLCYKLQGALHSHGWTPCSTYPSSLHTA